MGQKMKNAPVYFTIARVQFNPILDLESYVSAIQASLRHEYPDFNRAHTSTFVIAPGSSGDAPVPAQQSQSVRFLFTSMDRTAGLILDSTSLAFQTTAYAGFDSFSAALLRGLDVLNKVVGLTYVERIGLRYLDAVYPSEEETLSQYLIPEVLGLSEKLGGTLAHSFSETQAQNTTGIVVARIIIQDGPVGFPPDLASVGPSLNLASRFSQLRGRRAIIDTDARFERRESFEVSAVESRIEALHDEVDRAFRSLVTEHALHTWEQEH